MPFPVQVISLQRTPQRRAIFMHMNPGLNHQFLDAIDGKTLPESTLKNPTLFQHAIHFKTLGAYGCALSHLKCWDLAIERHEPITVAEDDAIFRADFQESSARAMAALPPDWDLILWGWNFNAIASILPMREVSPVVLLCDEARMRQQVETFRAMDEPARLFPLDKCFGIPAYTISPQGAKKYKSLCFPIRPMTVGFPMFKAPMQAITLDIVMNLYYPKTNTWLSLPALAVTPNDEPGSTIIRDE
jgi:glycosyl transferase family 25